MPFPPMRPFRVHACATDALLGFATSRSLTPHACLYGQQLGRKLPCVPGAGRLPPAFFRPHLAVAALALG